MISFTTGDILASSADALVNTVNCVGVMGRGVALQFKKRFPENFRAYALACKRGEVQPGRMFVFETAQLTNPRFVINFPTKRHWRGASQLPDIESGLEALVAEIISRKITSIAIPPLGAGLGGLVWADVRPLIERAVERLPGVDVIIFEPGGPREDEKKVASRAIPKMTAGRAALIALVDRYLGGLMDPSVTLLEIHKLMYFMQEAGEPLRLKYVEAPFGPYAENLRHVLSAIEGHFLSGYSDGGDAPAKQLSLVPGAIADAKAFLETDREAKTRLNRVADLVDGFETSFGLELLSTVHWIAARDANLGTARLTEKVYAWNERKRQFTPRQIGIAREVLEEKHWLSRDPAPAPAHP